MVHLLYLSNYAWTTEFKIWPLRIKETNCAYHNETSKLEKLDKQIKFVEFLLGIWRSPNYSALATRPHAIIFPSTCRQTDTIVPTTVTPRIRARTDRLQGFKNVYFGAGPSGTFIRWLGPFIKGKRGNERERRGRLPSIVFSCEPPVYFEVLEEFADLTGANWSKYRVSNGKAYFWRIFVGTNAIFMNHYIPNDGRKHEKIFFIAVFLSVLFQNDVFKEAWVDKG